MSAEGVAGEVSAEEAAAEPASAAPAASPPATSTDEPASKRAMRSLELAGRALDPTAAEGPALDIARVLLREAVVWAARAGSTDPAPELDFAGAVALLEQRGHLGGDAKAIAKTKAALAKLDASPAPADLATVELPIAMLVERAVGRRTLAKAERRRRWALWALAGAVALSIPIFTYFRFPSDSYPYRLSSAHKGYPDHGYIGRIYAFGLVLHTQQEREPWVEIDLEKERTIRKVTLKNRADCCHERGLPLIVEVAGPDKQWVEVARRNKPFDSWVVEFPERSARWVRLRSTSNTVLHYREIQVK